MQLDVLLFAAARDAAGTDSICVEVSNDPTARDVIEAVGRRLPRDLSFAAFVSFGGRLQLRSRRSTGFG